MQLRLTLEAPEPDRGRLALPCQYNELIQGFLYRHLDRWLARALHEEGLPDPRSEKRRLKLFTFSRLIPVPPGRWRLDDKHKQIIFTGPVELVVASPIEPFLASLLKHLLTERELQLGAREVRLLDVAVEPLPPYQSPMRVEALSPITAYRTLYTAEGKRKTYYFSPFEAEFERLLLQNLQRKLRAWRAWQALLGPVIEGSAVQPHAGGGEGGSEEGEVKGRIRPFKVSPRDEHVVLYKGTVIKAWTGIYELELPPASLRMAFDAGLGAKNSQGFGCIAPWPWRPSTATSRSLRA